MNGSNHRFCQKRSHSRWLDNGRHPSHPIHGDLFKHAPNWKVECIDVDRHTLFWHQEMVSSKRALPSQRHKISIGGEWRVGKLPSKACIGKQVADAAFNVDPAVCSCGACGPAHFVKVLFPFLKKQGQALEHSSSFLKRHFSESGPSDLPRIDVGPIEGEPLRIRQTNGLSSDGMRQRNALPAACFPFALQQVSNFLHGHGACV